MNKQQSPLLLIAFLAVTLISCKDVKNDNPSSSVNLTETKEVTKDAKEATADKATDLKEAATDKATDVKEAATDKATDVKEAAADKATDVKEAATDKATDVKEAATDKATDVKEAATEKATDVKEAATEKATEVKEAAADKATDAKEAAESPLGFDVNEKVPVFGSQLNSSIDFGDIDTAKELIKNGADVNVQTTNTKETALHLAVDSDKDTTELVEILLSVEDIDLELKDSEGKTALDLAKEQKKTKLVKLITDKK